MKYTIWGYVFGVEKCKKSGKWCAIGHAKGKAPYVLHKVGTADDQEEMQRKLRSWAHHVLATPVKGTVDAGQLALGV